MTSFASVRWGVGGACHLPHPVWLGTVVAEERCRGKVGEVEGRVGRISGKDGRGLEEGEEVQGRGRAGRGQWKDRKV